MVGYLRLLFHEEPDPVEEHLHGKDCQQHSHQPLGSLQAMPPRIRLRGAESINIPAVNIHAAAKATTNSQG